MKPWTVLVYLAGDNGRFLSSLEGEGVADLLEMKQVGSGDEVDVVAQFDAMADRGCRRYHLHREGSLSDDLVQDLGETNSGDAQVLLEFITWAVRSYPAERYLLVLWNHGNGWKDEDIYVPYRTLARRADLPVMPPQISGRRVSRALFRSSMEAIIEEEANRLALSRQGAVQTRGVTMTPDIPEGWLQPGGDQERVLRATVSPEPAVVIAPRSVGPPQARAICFDDSSKDFLDSRDLSVVLNATATLMGKKVDVLGMDACLMSMIEVAYQVRNGASIMVASEDAEPGSGWPYHDILTTLTSYPAISPSDLGKAITAHYVRAYDRNYLIADPVTQSALNLERVASATAAIDDLARSLLNGWRQKSLRSSVAEARYQAQSFMDPDYIDLFDFVSLLMNKTKIKPVLETCDRVLAAIDPSKAGSLVLADGHAGLAERNAHGLSIYFPKIGVSPFYAALDMSRDCAWARFLNTYLS